MFSQSVKRPKMPDGTSRSGPAHRRSTSTAAARLAPVAAGALLAAALAPLGAVPAGAETAGMGPVDPDNGFPTWYSDGTVKLQLCYMANSGCLTEPPDPNSPASYPDNFPDEAFWFNAEASGGNLGLYEAALEAAHANEAVIDGDQMGFGRLRFRLNNLQPNQQYTITHPYGVHTFTSEPDPQDPSLGEINVTLDEGCTPSGTTACDWASVGASFLGDFASGSTATFLRQDGAPAGTIGDINTARPVTGAPSGTNAVIVTGPDAGGPGIDTLTVSTFTVQGLIAEGSDGAPSTPDLVAASDTGRSSTDNVTRLTTPTVTGTLPAGDSGPVQLIVDDGAPRATTLTGSAYSATLAALPQGVHRVQSRIANPAFAADPTQPEFLVSPTLTFTVDTTAPAVSVTAPFPSSPSLDNTPTLSFSGEAQARFECQLQPSNPTWDATCASPKTWDAQANGTYVFNVRATDVAGNVSGAASRTVQIGLSTATAATPKLQDFNSDGRADIVSRDAGGRLWLYRGNGTGGFLAKLQIGTGWNVMSAIVSSGDFNGDRKADIVARDTAGALWLYRGNGANGFTGRVQIGNGWNGLNNIVAPGDFNGDRKADLAARDASGNLFLYFGNGTGGFMGNAQIGTGWNVMNTIVAPGDFNSDGKADLAARDASGNLWLYRGDGFGSFNGRVQIGSGWNGLTIAGPGDFNGDRKMDLTARDANGNLTLYRGNGATGFLGKTQIGTGWNTMNAIM
ncbi:VCBS repeat-containing protein [Arthrobacter sp. ISL-5]|uniref:VCBS repeat-containing protein n=1 Tax=Arthrobacter sp. ISL-5 TaxID=2819111 RepID=UPI001BEA8B5F|nr:VCBS repeat-containing protein [Arthrobacter sp. ISL-5]MBT2553127.1 VCBS repeat-containing protein [Arthrobacter sp. ISL-5]